MNKYLVIGIIVALIIGGGWWYFLEYSTSPKMLEKTQLPMEQTNQKDTRIPEENIQSKTEENTANEAPITQEPSIVSVNTNTRDYKGAMFKITYPANFIAKKEGPDEASFTSPDGSIQFYIYSPMWSGDPISYLQALSTEKIESDISIPNIKLSLITTSSGGAVYDKEVDRYVTFTAKDGSYKRSLVSITEGFVDFPDSTEYGSKTHKVFGIKYKDQATYNAYLNDYLAFKKSLVQYLD